MKKTTTNKAIQMHLRKNKEDKFGSNNVFTTEKTRTSIDSNMHNPR